MTKHLFERIMEAKERLQPIQSQYRVVYELPDGDDETCAGVLVPDPNWLAMALAGGYLPPIEAYLSDLSKMYGWMAETERLKKQGLLDPTVNFSWDKVGGATHPYVDPIGPMTEEQAIEYLIMKDLPPAVWADHETANKPRFKIVRTEMVPTDRSYRNAWRIAE